MQCKIPRAGHSFKGLALLVPLYFREYNHDGRHNEMLVQGASVASSILQSPLNKCLSS